MALKRATSLVASASLKLAVAAVVVAAGIYPAPAASADAPFEGPVPRANCASNDPYYLEPALQGEVPLKDRNSGRSQGGYRCNLELVGQHAGQGAGWQNDWYDHCDYYDTKTAEDPTKFPNGNGNGQTSPGVQVIDVSDPAQPKLTANLDTPAMDGPWESMKVNAKRGLLAGVGGFGADGNGPLYFDVYDVKGDCSHPKLLSSSPINVPIGHEGNWASDGLTYYASPTYTGTTVAIDVTDPTSPSLITTFKPAVLTHGLSVSDDGKTIYLADPTSTNGADGLDIWDVSQIQSRSGPVATPVGSVTWSDGGAAQHTIPVTYSGKPYLVFVDEGGGCYKSQAVSLVCAGTGQAGLVTSGVPAGAARLIDISDPANPKVVSVARLEIQMPENYTENQADITGDGTFGYEAHYCSVDRRANPTALACGYFQSGIRVFDIRDPKFPKEIAYYNPPALVSQVGKLPGSEHGGGTTDWCASQIGFHHASDGAWMLWAACQDNGFMALRFTNGAYPLNSGTAAASTQPSFAVPAISASGAMPNTAAGRPVPLLVLTLVLGFLTLSIVGRVFGLRHRRRPSPESPSG